jgi:hypothetical protein
MIYSTDLANQVTLNNNSSNTKYLEAGIHDNVKFTSVKTAVSPTGKNFIEFRFEKDGKELVHTEWEPKERAEDTEEQNQNKATNQVTRINRILRCFYPKEVLNFTGSSYKEFTNWVVAMLNAANKDTLLKVKVVYNKDGYTTLPSYVKFAAIEPMNIPMGFYEEGKNESMIREITGIDLFVKPVVSDKETVVVNPLEVKSEAPSDDLPF